MRNQRPQGEANGQGLFDSVRTTWYKVWAEEMARLQFRIWLQSRAEDGIPTFVCNACAGQLELLEADLGKGWVRLLCPACKALQVYQKRRLGGWKLRYIRKAKPPPRDHA